MQSVYKFLYGPPLEERVKKWKRQLQSESRSLDREIRKLDNASVQTKANLKQLANKGQVSSAKILAKELVRTQHHRNKLVTAQARLNSISMQLQQQLAIQKVNGTLQKSTEVMKLSNSLIRIPQLQETMRQFSMEMTKAGLMEEMLNDTLDVEDDEEVEEEADEEIEKVLYEITDGKLGQAGKPAQTELPEPTSAPQADETEEEEEQQRMQQQLNAILRG